MQRWGLPENKLPAGTVVLFHTPTLFEQFRAEVLTAGGMILFQTLLLFTLIVQFHQRRVAEQKGARGDHRTGAANRMTSMGEMTATIAHEVNQPLAAIVANASAAQRWLDRASPNIAEARTELSRIAVDGHRAAEVISTVRSMFADRSGDRSTVDLAEVTQNILLLAAGELTAVSVVLKSDIRIGLPAVLGDRVQLHQVVLNLVLNAIEAMHLVPGAGRVLAVALAAQGQQIVLTVGDSGPGISTENQSRMFDTFFTTKPKGMGMGLSICRTIMAAHGGELTVAESGPGDTLMRCAWPAKSAGFGGAVA
ncbi:sensor histidine kinase [Cypionkella psychrotolerans]|uniref:sensor histidine kinase n=1 Tax=Cypionkella psychrotolerans TaxID=1678131 RepID=UPI0006B3FFD7|nr:ATP-binding protein [Cypionkella psychrotolerans]